MHVHSAWSRLGCLLPTAMEAVSVTADHIGQRSMQDMSREQH